MADDNKLQEEEQEPQDQTGFIEGIERTPEVDEALKEYGLDDIDETEDEKKEEPQTPETPAETPEDKTQEPVKAVEEKPEEEVEISEEQAQKLIEDSTGTKKEDEVYPWEKEGREPTEREVLDYVAKKSADIQEQRRLDEEKTKEDQQNKVLDEYKTMWNGNIDFLEKNNHIPKVVKKDDNNDPGIKARQILFEQSQLHGELDLEKVYWRYAKPLIDGEQPAGANAPIATKVNADTEKEDDDDFFYDDIHGKDPSREYDSVELES